MDPFEKLKSLLSKINEEPRYYFYYDPITNEIIYMKNHLEDEEYPYLELLKSDIVDLEMPSMNDFSIVDVDGKKQVVQKQKTIKIDTIEDIIYQIPRQTADPNIKISQANYTFDLLVEQDNIKKEFRFRLSSPIKEQYDHKNLNQVMSFYVTAENDPNILYKTLKIEINQLLSHHYYTIAYDDFDAVDCNIFSRRYFQRYLHMVIE
jgi:hypothetical protein